MAAPKKIEINIQPHYKQHLAYQKLLDQVTEAVLFGGAANGGKTWLGCEWLMMMCLMYPGIRAFMGREELKRLRTTSLRTFFKVAKFHDIPTPQVWEFKAGKDYTIEFANGSVIDLLDLKYLPSDPMYERYGSSEYTIGWIEEAGEVHFACFDILSSRVGRHRNTEFNIKGKLLITANPKKNWMYQQFYKPWRDGTLPDNYAFIQSLPTDNVYAEKGSVERLDQLKIESQRQRLRYGNWDYADDPDQLITYDLIVENCEPQEADFADDKKLGVDVARYGDDSSGICQKTGKVIHKIKKIKGNDTHQLSDLIIEIAESEGINATDINIDGVGVGAGVIDSLKHRTPPWFVNDIQSGSKVPEDPETHYQFKNMRAKLWWEFKLGLQEGNIKFSKELQHSEYWDELCDDLMAPKYYIQNEKVITIEKKDDIKKRLGRSPDLGEAVIYSNYDYGFKLLI